MIGEIPPPLPFTIPDASYKWWYSSRSTSTRTGSDDDHARNGDATAATGVSTSEGGKVRSPFYHYMIKKKLDMAARGFHLRSLEDVKEVAGRDWERMTTEQRMPYVEMTNAQKAARGNVEGTSISLRLTAFPSSSTELTPPPLRRTPWVPLDLRSSSPAKEGVSAKAEQSFKAEESVKVKKPAKAEVSTKAAEPTKAKKVSAEAEVSVKQHQLPPQRYSSYPPTRPRVMNLNVERHELRRPLQRSTIVDATEEEQEDAVSEATTESTVVPSPAIAAEEKKKRLREGVDKIKEMLKAIRESLDS